MMTPTENACKNGLIYSKETTKDHKKSKGQFFTPVEISNFMASLSEFNNSKEVLICDPGCGPAILTCSLVEKLIGNGVEKVDVDLFETDLDIIELTTKNLNYLKDFCEHHGVIFNFRLFSDNFLIYVSQHFNEVSEAYDIVISNPPYFKLRKGDLNIAAVNSYVSGITNIYAGFVAASISICKISGECIFIVPRSFTAGLYFKSLRKFIFKETRIKRVHLFGSRTKTFKGDKVLQETLIFRTSNNEGATTEISVSDGLTDLDTSVTSKYQITDLVDLDSEDKVLHLPKCKDDFDIIQKLRRLDYNLSDHNIMVSTGRVVAFRAKPFITQEKSNNSVPLIWGDNITEQKLTWPLKSSKKKQYINSNAGNLLIPSGNYVVQRRFSTKEDRKRLICAPIVKSDLEFDLLGFENKTNFFYKVKSEFTEEQVYGLSVILNSTIYDSYFRMINGNINVSSTEMRLLPVPSMQIIEEVGKKFISSQFESKLLDEIVENTLFSNVLTLEVA